VGGGQLSIAWLCAVLRSKLAFLESAYWRYLRTTRGTPPLPQLLRDIGGGHPRLGQILDEAEHDTRLAPPWRAGEDGSGLPSGGVAGDETSREATVSDNPPQPQVPPASLLRRLADTPTPRPPAPFLTSLPAHPRLRGRGLFSYASTPSWNLAPFVWSACVRKAIRTRAQPAPSSHLLSLLWYPTLHPPPTVLQRCL
jgi:hypothetical protein